MQRFHSEIVAMLLSVWTKWENFLLPVCIWILGGQWKVILPSIFIWKVNFLYLQLVSHIGSHQKRIWKVDLKQHGKFKSSLLLELLHRISVFSIVHETIDSTVCSYGRGRAGWSQVLLCQGLCLTGWERRGRIWALFIPVKLYFQFSELKFEAWEIILMVLFFSIHIDFLKCSVWED